MVGIFERDKDICHWTTSPDKTVSIRQLVNILCIVYFEDVTGRELDLLCEIINVGEVSREAKEAFQISYKTNKDNTAQILARLTTKGILIPKKNRSGKDLHPKFQSILDITLGQVNKTLLLTYGGV